MTIRFACRCGKKMKTSDDKIGKKILCSACGSPVVVPSGNTVSIERVVAPAAAADTASALLRGTAAPPQKKTKKTIAFDDPGITGESTYDATETAKYFTMGFILPAAGVTLACLIIYALVSWATRGDSKHPPLAEVEGSVYLDDAPLAGAQIFFHPRPNGKIKAAASVARTDANGRFRMQYTKDAFGVPIGECTVQISSADSSGREIVPIRYRDRTEVREVKEGKNTFDFQLKTREQ